MWCPVSKFIDSVQKEKIKGQTGGPHLRMNAENVKHPGERTFL